VRSAEQVRVLPTLLQRSEHVLSGSGPVSSCGAEGVQDGLFLVRGTLLLLLVVQHLGQLIERHRRGLDCVAVNHVVDIRGNCRPPRLRELLL
jgi:hypothetical protein